MTDTVLVSLVGEFTKEQLRAIEAVLNILDTEEYRDYHGQFGVCNAPERIELLRDEVRTALERS